MSATSPLRVHPRRSVRRTSGLVLVGNPEVDPSDVRVNAAHLAWSRVAGRDARLPQREGC
jgi:hypothetical protein